MRMGELFAGIGGFSLGFQRAGFDIAWQVEIDPWCRKVLSKNFPHVEKFDDVRTSGRVNLKPVDVICGGFPCQDISNAGKRKGITGERSGLWKEFHRIINELVPRYVVIENSSALRNKQGGLGVVLADLAASGYDARWETLPASSFGAPHGRERIWIVAHAHHDGPHRPQRHETLTGGDEPQKWIPVRSDWWRDQPGVGRVVHGIPNRIHRLRGLGNAAVPQITEFLARQILEDSKNERQASR